MKNRACARRVSGVRLCCAAAAAIGLLASFSAGAAEPAAAEPAPVEEVIEDEALDELEEVIVYGTSGKLIAGLTAESELDAASIAAYGASSVGDLIGQVATDVDNSNEGPVILINGRPANGISSVNDLPAEVVASMQVLPPQAAAALGYSPTRRVINVVLRQSFGQEVANVTMRGATAGRGVSTQANVGSIRLEGNRFRDMSLRISKTEPLLEAHRDIVTDPGLMPYDLLGNVLSWPAPGGDIDPDLSAMAGYPVTVAGVPAGTTDPALADFLAQANSANVSDMGRFRTLVADQYSFGLNGNWNFPLPRNMSFNMNVNAERSESISQSGATTSLLHVPASSPYSPFSQDVSIARYLGRPLQQESDPWFASLNSSFNAQLGKWRTLLSGNFNWRESTTVNERRVDTSALQAAIDAGTVNPFDPLSAALLGDMLTDRATYRGHNASLQLQTSASVLKLPAGDATFSARGELRQSEQRSRTVGTNNVSSRHKRQDELAFASLQVPLLGNRNQPNLPNVPPGVTLPAGMAGPPGQRLTFGMGAELSGSARDVSVVGTLFDYGYGLNARLGNRINLRVGVNHEKIAPQPDALTNPVVTIDDYRAYDFIRQETVLVRYITGGNPDLKVEERRRVTIGGNARPWQALDLNFNAEYQRTVGHDAVSALPAVSEDVQAAFPDRYVRDADGRLIEIDARLVSFARSETEQIRWGGNFRRAFAVPAPTARSAISQPRVIINDGSAGDELSGTGWRLNANFTHTWQLANKRLAREGLPAQDLLAGGIGTGSSQSRHTLQGRAGLGHNGVGAQLTMNWKSRTRITAGTTADPNDIVFSPLLRFDLSAFANLGTVFPGTPLLTDTRLTLNVENLLDAQQKVRDETGVTPLRYQPYLLNALGRTVSLSLRKMF